MSDEFIETMWTQFGIETEEHIEGIESLLVKADAQALAADDISTLFRAFHSLKGLSRVMELGALEGVTHRCEDLLGLVREGSLSLDKALVDLFLQALDIIKALREVAVGRRSDGERPDALIATLEARYAAAVGGDPNGPAAAAAPSAAAAAAYRQDATTPAHAAPVAEAYSAAAAPSPAPPPPPPPLPPAPRPAAKAVSKPPARPLTDEETRDQETIFLRLVKNGLPILEQLAASIASHAQADEIVAVANDIRKPLSWMIRACQKLGYIGIQQRIEELIDVMPRDVSFSSESGEKVVEGIVALLADLRVLSETTGIDLGGESLVTVLARTMRDSLRQPLNEIELCLNRLDSGVDLGDEDLADVVSQEFSRVHGYMASLFPGRSFDLPLLLVDAFARAARRQLSLYGGLIDLTRDAVGLIREVGASTAKSPLDQPHVVARLAAVGKRMKDLLWSNDGSGDAPAAAVKSFLATLAIPPELAALLSAENTRDLMQAIQTGHVAYMITAHLESSEELASAFLAWIAKRGVVVTNRSVFVDEVNWYEMLFISKAPRHLVEAELREIDRGRELLRLAAPLGSAAAAEPVAATGATPGADAAATQPAAADPASSTARAPARAAGDASAPGGARAAPAPAAAASARSSGSSSNVIRVPGEMLDQFMNQIGEMVLVRGQLAHVIADQRLRETALALRRVADRLASKSEGSSDMHRLLDLVDEQSRRLQETDALIQGALSRLQDSVMGLRVVPVELVFKRFPRMLRDLAQAQGKQIRLELVGQEVKIDKAMVESLADPLLHMVRNSADHGIETPEERRRAGKPEEAVVRIMAEQQGGRIAIRVSDDGKGIDPERVRRKAVERGLIKEEESHSLSRDEILSFIFRAGFSTAEVVTETSGRGVGMDVVRTNVMRLGGSIHLESEIGRGTTFTMQMPLSAAVQEVLLVRAAGQTLAIPGRYVAEIVEAERSELQSVKRRKAIMLRGNFLPVMQLDELLGFQSQAVTGSLNIVVLSDGQRTLGVAVDAFVGRQELFTKDIHPRLAALPGVGGASILGDGRVVLILDGAALYKLAESSGPRTELLLAA